MEIAYNNNEAKKFYQEVKSIRKGCQQQMLLIRDKEGNRVNNKKVLQRWSEYYEKHFELQDGNDSGEKWTMCVQTAEPYVEPPKMQTEMAISELKNGKAIGHDQIMAEWIEEGGKVLKEVIYELILKILEEESGNMT